jgi:hypothetical protein
MRSLLAVTLCAASLLVAGCGGVAGPSQNTIENFEGTIVPGGGNVHEFDVRQRNGEYSANIVALSPTQSALLNVALGGVANGVCNPYLGATVIAGINRPGPSGSISQGHYCIQVYDQGTLTVPHTYTLRVSHP